MRFRRAQPGDALPVAELLNRLIADQDGTALTQPVSVEQEAGYLRGLLREGCCLLAEDNGVLLGFQSVERLGPEAGEIGTFVRRQSRGQGVGRGLLTRTRAWAEAQGLSVLRAQVAADNPGGQRAYQTWGFVDALPDDLDPYLPPGQPAKIQLVLKLG